MRRTAFVSVLLVAVTFVIAVPGVGRAQLADPAAWAAQVQNEYRVVPDVTYLTANNHENNIDLYMPRNATSPTPVVMYFHGGGWVGGAKEGNVLRLLPYLEMGWAVANVQYRLGRVSMAPAAVEDCLCALRWVVRNAKEYNLDTARIIVTGHSAGGHLALTTGMIPAAAGLDRQCPGQEQLRVAAIINWYGITDVAELLDGQNMRSYAVQWFGSMPDRVEIAKRVSPLTYVRAGLPPTLTVHGDADPTVPYQQAIRLREALTKTGVKNELYTVPGGGHGNFVREHQVKAHQAIQRFLSDIGLRAAAPTTQQQ